MPKVCRTDTVISGMPVGITSFWCFSVAVAVSGIILIVFFRASGFEERSAGEVAGLKGRIGEVDLFQFFLGFFIAAMHVGVMALHQLLIAHLETRQGERRRQVEEGERLLLDRARPLRRLLRRRVLVEIKKAKAAPFRAAQGADSGAERPGRALPDRVMPDMGLDLGAAHPGVVIPGGVIGTHMIEAEPVEIVERHSRAWRPELARGGATGMVARSRRNRGRIVAIRKTRTGHLLSMGAARRCDKPRHVPLRALDSAVFWPKRRPTLYGNCHDRCRANSSKTRSRVSPRAARNL